MPRVGARKRKRPSYTRRSSGRPFKRRRYAPRRTRVDRMKIVGRGGYGGAVGAFLGQAAGDAITYFTGRGDYVVRKNAFLSPSGGGMPPVVNPTNGGGVMIRRSEYLGDVITSSSANTFKLTSYPLNPGLETTFAWLSQVAANFDEWECEGMYFEFKSTSANALNSTNTALGTVVMAANYNSANPNFASKQEMESYEGGTSIKPSENMRYFVECAKSQTVLNDLYVRSGDVPTGQDIRFYDLANFQIATTGMQGTSVNIGELWVSYQVNLRKPKLFIALGLYDSFYNATMTGVTNALPYGTARTENEANNLGITFDSTNLIMTFPWNSLPQYYKMLIRWTGTSTAVTYPAFTPSAGFTMVLEYAAPQGGATCTTCMENLTFAIPGNLQVQPSISVGVAGTLPASVTSAEIFIIQIPNTYVGL